MVHSLSSRITVNDDVLFQDLNGEGVLLNLKSGVYFGLNQVGTRVWQLLEEHSVLAEILDRLLEEFDVPSEECSRDLLNLVLEMEQQGLVTISANQ